MIILTEKYLVARDFAVALNCKEKAGYFESPEYSILFCNGHLFQLSEPEAYDVQLKKWRQETLPIIPETFSFSPLEHTKKERNTIEYIFARHQHDDLLIATDPEREGELIARIILRELGGNHFRSIKRFWCSQTLTKEVIWREIKRAKDITEYDHYFEEGLVRQQADWLIGINLTRAMTLYAGTLFHVGRVQTTLLKVIYERNREIAAFTRQPYTELVAVLGDKKPMLAKLTNDDGSTRFPLDSSYITSAYSHCAASSYASIIRVIKHEEAEPPPHLYNQSALQQDAYRAYGIMPHETEAICQRLYAVYKCISYPRTDSRVMTDTEDDMRLLIKVYRLLAPLYRTLARESSLTHLYTAKQRIFDSDGVRSHTALIPLANIPACSADERAVFNLILKNFFAVFASPYVWEKIVMEVTIAGFPFVAHGITVIEKGWRAIYTDTFSADSGQEMTNVSGTTIGVSRVYVKNDLKRPPEYYSIDSLIGIMANPMRSRAKKPVGLGTVATRHIVIKGLFQREYIKMYKNHILITEKGKALIEHLYENPAASAFFSLDKAAWWEEQLAQNTHKVLEDIKQFIPQTIDAYGKIRDGRLNQLNENSLGLCPVCGKQLYENSKSWYCSGFATGCSFGIWKTIGQRTLHLEELRTLLKGKALPFREYQTHAGEKFIASLVLDMHKKSFVRFQYPEELRYGS